MDKKKPPPDFSTWNFSEGYALYFDPRSTELSRVELGKETDPTFFATVRAYAHPFQPAAGLEFNFFNKGVIFRFWGLTEDGEDSEERYDFQKMSKAVFNNNSWYVLSPGEDLHIYFCHSLEVGPPRIVGATISVYRGEDCVFEFKINR